MKKLPIPDELNNNLMNYGNKEQRINFHNTDIEYSIPKIENGYYSIFDRTPESRKQENPYAYSNADILLYDIDTNILYFYSRNT